MLWDVINGVNVSFSCCRKFVTGTSNWKIHSWMEAQRHASKYVILVTPRWVAKTNVLNLMEFVLSNHLKGFSKLERWPWKSKCVTTKPMHQMDLTIWLTWPENQVDPLFMWNAIWRSNVDHQKPFFSYPYLHAWLNHGMSGTTEFVSRRAGNIHQGACAMDGLTSHK